MKCHKPKRIEIFERRYKGNGLEVTMGCEIPILNPSIRGFITECYEYVTWEKRDVGLQNYSGSENTTLYKGVS